MSIRWTHFTLPVSDLEASIRFLTEVCELSVVRDRRTEGGSTVWIGPRPAAGSEPEFVVVLQEGIVREPLDHFGFQCARREQVTAIADRARATGSLVEGPHDAGGSVGYYAVVREPSGHLVEFTFGQPLAGLRGAAEILPRLPTATPEPIETGRLRLRLVAESDLPALLEVNGDDTVTRFLPYATWNSPADAQAWYQRMSDLQAKGAALQFVVIDKRTERAIGTCLLFQFDQASGRAEIGYALGRAHWGKGIMREALGALIERAFGELALRRLEAQVDPRNQASGRLLLRLGFTREGLLRQRWFTKGDACDVEAYGLLRHEWPRPA
jgi:ribosomal-protein-alanine N-acetyltransferase